MHRGARYVHDAHKSPRKPYEAGIDGKLNRSLLSRPPRSVGSFAYATVPLVDTFENAGAAEKHADSVKCFLSFPISLGLRPCPGLSCRATLDFFRAGPSPTIFPPASPTNLMRFSSMLFSPPLIGCCSPPSVSKPTSIGQDSSFIRDISALRCAILFSLLSDGL